MIAGRVSSPPGGRGPCRVDDVERYWSSAPPAPSPRFLYWQERYRDGFRPNRRIRSMGYYCAAEWYGVYLWEYLKQLYPLEQEAIARWEAEQADHAAASLGAISMGVA